MVSNSVMLKYMPHQGMSIGSASSGPGYIERLFQQTRNSCGIVQCAHTTGRGNQIIIYIYMSKAYEYISTSILYIIHLGLFVHQCQRSFRVRV